MCKRIVSLGRIVSLDLPSLVYPDGRFFLDMDLRAVVAYLDAEGIDLDSKLVTQTFPREVVESVRANPLRRTYMTPVMNEILRDARHSTQTPSNLHWQRQLALVESEAEPFHPFSHPLPPATIGYRVVFTGTGDFFACQARAHQ